MKLLGNYLKSNTFLSLLAGSGPFTELHPLHLFLIRIKPPIYSQSSLSLFGCSLVRVFHLLAAVLLSILLHENPLMYCSSMPLFLMHASYSFASNLSNLVSRFLMPYLLPAFLGKGLVFTSCLTWDTST